MRLYHGSPVAGLAALVPSLSPYFGKPRQVCLSGCKPMALLYGIRNVEYTYGFSKDGRLQYVEYFPDALEKLYRGKSASLYLCSWQEGLQTTEIPNEFVSAEAVPVETEIQVPDLCAALLEEERLGSMEIIRWQSLTADQQAWIAAVEKNEILEAGLLAAPDSPRARYMMDKYPESWAMARLEMEDDNESAQ